LPGISIIQPLDVFMCEDSREFMDFALSTVYKELGVSQTTIDEMLRILKDSHNHNLEAVVEMLRTYIHHSDIGEIFDAYRNQTSIKGKFDLVKDHIQGPVLADIGAGTGELALKIIDAFPAIEKIIATETKQYFDIDHPQIEFRQQTQQNKIPIKTGAVNTVILSYVFHHMRRNVQKEILNEIYRILVIGGKIIVLEDTHSTLLSMHHKSELMEKFLRLGYLAQMRVLAFSDYLSFKVFRGIDISLPFSYRTIEAWHRFFEKGKFTVVQQEFVGRPIGNFHFVPRGVIVLEKREEIVSEEASLSAEGNSPKKTNRGKLLSLIPWIGFVVAFFGVGAADAMASVFDEGAPINGPPSPHTILLEFSGPGFGDAGLWPMAYGVWFVVVLLGMAIFSGSNDNEKKPSSFSMDSLKEQDKQRLLRIYDMASELISGRERLLTDKKALNEMGRVLLQRIEQSAHEDELPYYRHLLQEIYGCKNGVVISSDVEYRDVLLREAAEILTQEEEKFFESLMSRRVWLRLLGGMMVSFLTPKWFVRIADAAAGQITIYTPPTKVKFPENMADMLRFDLLSRVSESTSQLAMRADQLGISESRRASIASVSRFELMKLRDDMFDAYVEDVEDLETSVPDIAKNTGKIALQKYKVLRDAFKERSMRFVDRLGALMFNLGTQQSKILSSVYPNNPSMGMNVAMGLDNQIDAETQGHPAQNRIDQINEELEQIETDILKTKDEDNLTELNVRRKELVDELNILMEFINDFNGFAHSQSQEDERLDAIFKAIVEDGQEPRKAGLTDFHDDYEVSNV